MALGRKTEPQPLSASVWKGTQKKASGHDDRSNQRDKEEAALEKATWKVKCLRETSGSRGHCFCIDHSVCAHWSCKLGVVLGCHRMAVVAGNTYIRSWSTLTRISY